MQLNLVNVVASDLRLLADWCASINADLYMSRVTPIGFTRAGSLHNELWKWYLIKDKKMPLGTIWLEKAEKVSAHATMGIYLGEEKYFNKGIGSWAIHAAISAAQSDLGFRTVGLNVRKTNKRAIGCYQKCGFLIVSEGVKINEQKERIELFTMQKHL